MDNITNIMDNTVKRIFKKMLEEGDLLTPKGERVARAYIGAPTMTVEPKQRTGHWMDREVYDSDRWKCSECGRTEQYKTNYCPSCGAKMEI